MGLSLGEQFPQGQRLWLLLSSTTTFRTVRLFTIDHFVWTRQTQCVPMKAKRNRLCRCVALRVARSVGKSAN